MICRLRLPLWCFFACLVLCQGCKPTVPGKYIQPDDMEDILYDFHLADAMAMNDYSGPDMSYHKELYRRAVFDKYGVSKADFDSSLAYYYRDTERLKNIYINIEKRLTEEAKALGSSANDINLYSSEGIKGDTANVWVSGRTTILIPKAPDNLISFAVKADTAYHPGDKMMLNFDVQYIIQDGSRDAVAMLAMRLGNDSVAKHFLHLSSNTHYSLQLTDNGHLGIKEVGGYVSLPPHVSNTTTTMKLLCLYNLKLVRMHEIVKPTTDADSLQQTKSTKSQTITSNPQNDSLRRGIPTQADSVRKKNLKGLPSQPIKSSESTSGGRIGR